MAHTAVDPLFQRRLRELREQRGLSLRGLGAIAGFSGTYIWELEQGRKNPTAQTAALLDDALRAGGMLRTLVPGAAEITPVPLLHTARPLRVPAGHAKPKDQEDPVRRRSLLRNLAATAGGVVGTLIAAEAARSALGLALDATGAYTVADWQEIADDATRTFHLVEPAILAERITADLAVLSCVIDDFGDSPAARDLCTVAARLAVVMAVTEAYRGQTSSRRWWGTARAAARRSTDVTTVVWVGGEETVAGLYERRPLPQLLAIADRTLAAGRGTVSVGTARVLAGRAQALAMTGRTDEALATLRRLEALTGALDANVLADETSMLGWPEHRLRYTQSWVYTHLGRTRDAYAAQDAALSLYPPELARLRAQVEIQRAACMVIDGHLADGLDHAHDTLDALPAQLHNAAVRETARLVLAAVPAQQRALSADLAVRLAP